MTLRPLTARERNTLLGLALVYAAVVIPVGIHRGGDLVQEILQSDRLLRGLPLYGQNPEKGVYRSEEHTSELQSRRDLVCRLLLEKKKETSESASLLRLSTHEKHQVAT